VQNPEKEHGKNFKNNSCLGYKNPKLNTYENLKAEAETFINLNLTAKRG
jgi:hypothetical protein